MLYEKKGGREKSGKKKVRRVWQRPELKGDELPALLPLPQLPWVSIPPLFYVTNMTWSMIMLGQKFLNGSLIKIERATTKTDQWTPWIRTSWEISGDLNQPLLSLFHNFPTQFVGENCIPHVFLSYQLSPDLHPVIRQLVEWDDEPTCSGYELHTMKKKKNEKKWPEYFTKRDGRLKEGKKKNFVLSPLSRINVNSNCWHWGQIEMRIGDMCVYIVLNHAKLAQPIRWTLLYS